MEYIKSKTEQDFWKTKDGKWIRIYGDEVIKGDSDDDAETIARKVSYGKALKIVKKHIKGRV